MGRKTKKTAKGQAPPTNSDKAPLTQSDKAPPTQAEPAQGPVQGNVNTSAAVPELSKSARKEVAELITSLLEVCSKPPESGNKELEDYPEINGLVEKIRNIQSVLALPPRNREEGFPTFLKWLNDNGVDTSALEITQFPQYGYGLKATRDLKESEKLLQIPRKLMMTVDSAKQSPLGALIKEDKILQVMPNVTLALHLLNEKLNPQSFWKPYIDILPSSYLNPLYWSSEDLQLLNGSPVKGDAINQYRNIARQYAYFYRLLQKQPDSMTQLYVKQCFTFDNYRWAVSSVMTRQNQIPARDGSRATLGLIPLWDMCNHCNGIYTSDYNTEQDACECFCLKDFEAGQQILMFYGPRSNGEFLVHNGFVYPDNEHDRLCLKLGISKSDPLYTQKSDLLSKLSLAPQRAFYLHLGRFPVDGDLMAFLRVFCMDEGVLTEKFSGEVSAGELEALKDEDSETNNQNDEKVWTFLQTRANLLLKTYPGSLEEDEAVATRQDVPETQKMAAQLKVGERKILLNTIDYADKKKASLKSSE
ncbi:histone-lysine N-methyltransferase setd3 [Biomphalaria glabrata]|nr:histone-lysine N-methyltransferase setd3-like [Biomphalaria glabrata]